MSPFFDFVRLTRPGIVAMVLFAMAVAAWTAGGEPPSWPVLAHALVGTGMVIVGAIVINQRLEVRGDTLMARTAKRPLPSGRLSVRQVTCFGVFCSAAGCAYLVLFSRPGVVAVAAVSWVIYVWTYTPLKSRSVWQTAVGAVAGAMPMLLGATVVQSPMSPMALTLFGIVYFWQFPHSMAIAWLYRDEFAAADVKLATVVDPSGRSAGKLALFGAAALLPVTLLPALFSAGGWMYVAVAVVLGTLYLVCSLRFLGRRDDVTARWLLRASLIYLPVLFVALLM